MFLSFWIFRLLLASSRHTMPQSCFWRNWTCIIVPPLLWSHSMFFVAPSTTMAWPNTKVSSYGIYGIWNWLFIFVEASKHLTLAGLAGSKLGGCPSQVGTYATTTGGVDSNVSLWGCFCWSIPFAIDGHFWDSKGWGHCCVFYFGALNRKNSDSWRKRHTGLVEEIMVSR